MNNQSLNIIYKNSEKLEKGIKSTKKIKDYGIYWTTVRESVVYPELARMKQDIWLSKNEKIEIKYIDEEDKFEIILIFKEESLIEALDILKIYMSHWNNEIYADNVKVEIKDKKIPILEYDQLCLKLKKESLKLEEKCENEIYSIIYEGLWINIEKTLEIIKYTENIDRVSIKIKKIKGKNNFWEHMSCIHISHESKYYEKGYLEDLEWKRIQPYLIENSKK